MKNFFVLTFFILLSFLGFTQTGDRDLLDAVINKDEKKVFYLLQGGTDANTSNEDGVSALMFAVESGNLYITKLLITNGANINAKPNYGGVTALIAACKKNNFEIAEFLLQNNAEVNATDDNNNTSLIYAAYFGYPMLSDILCSNSADVSIKGNNGDALIVAAFFGDNEICEILLKYGADVNSKDNFDFTPLMSAAYQGHTETVKLLAGNGADLNLRNFTGFSALDLAVQEGFKETAQVLLEKGAEISYGNENNVSTHTIADINGRNGIMDILNKSKNSKRGKPYFNRYLISFPLNFNNRDFLMGADFTFCEIKYRFDISAGYLVRPFRKSVLIKERENFYFMYKEHTNLFYVDLQKKIRFYNSNAKEFGLFAGAKESFRYGNYSGSNKKHRELIFSPELGLYFIGKNMSFKINYEYSPFKTYNNINHRINFSTGFVINKDFSYSYKTVSF